MSTDLSANQIVIDTASSTGSRSHQSLQSLPGPSSMATKLDMSGEGDSVKIDHLGPFVVGTDGKLSRISSWEHMTEVERTGTLRVLGRRNKERIEALKAAGKRWRKRRFETKGPGKRNYWQRKRTIA